MRRHLFVVMAATLGEPAGVVKTRMKRAWCRLPARNGATSPLRWPTLRLEYRSHGDQIEVQ